MVVPEVASQTYQTAVTVAAFFLGGGLLTTALTVYVAPRIQASYIREQGRQSHENELARLFEKERIAYLMPVNRAIATLASRAWALYANPQIEQLEQEYSDAQIEFEARMTDLAPWVAQEDAKALLGLSENVRRLALSVLAHEAVSESSPEHLVTRQALEKAIEVLRHQGVENLRRYLGRAARPT